MRPTTQAIMNAVAQKQGDLSDRQFSITVLGISPPYYCLLKQGRRRLTLDILAVVMQKFPDLAPAVTEYIMRQGNDGLDGETPEKQHDNSGVSEENHTPHPKLARKPSKSAQCR